MTGQGSRPEAEPVSFLPKAYAADAEPVLNIKPSPAPVSCAVQWPAGAPDMDKLAYAVGMYETSQCTNPGSPTANARNNCHGIMLRTADGGRTLRTFASTADSAAYFKAIWTKGYGARFPTFADAKKYSGNDRACTWLTNVHRFYTQ